MLDPSAPLDRRAALVLRAHGLTAADVGAHGLDSLRTRLALEDGADLTARLTSPAPADDREWLTDGIVEALQKQHGRD